MDGFLAFLDLLFYFFYYAYLNYFLKEIKMTKLFCLFIGCFLITSTQAVVTKEQLLDVFDEEARSYASPILEEIYEADGKKHVPHGKGEKESQYGQEKACVPETLHYLLQHCQGKTIFELGGGSGNISLLFVLAGAQEVVLNDLSKEALRHALTLFNTFPDKYKKPQGEFTMSFKKGDGISLMRKEENKGRFDVVIARNVLHFFTTQQLTNFWDALAFSTKEGAFFDVMTHNINAMNTLFSRARKKSRIKWDEEGLKKSNEAAKEGETSFCMRSFFHNCSGYYSSILPQDAQEDPSPLDHEAKTIGKDETDEEKLNKLGESEELLAKLNEIFSLNSHLPNLRFHTTSSRFFFPETLSNMAEEIGFFPLQAGYLMPNGHVVEEGDEESLGTSSFGLFQKKSKEAEVPSFDGMETKEEVSS